MITLREVDIVHTVSLSTGIEEISTRMPSLAAPSKDVYKRQMPSMQAARLAIPLLRDRKTQIEGEMLSLIHI